MIKFATMFASALAVLAAVPDTAPMAVTLFADGTTNSWTAADLTAALQLTNRKYHRDMQKSQGRVDWHGPVVRRVEEETTNDLWLIEYHEDGFAWTNRSSRPSYTPFDRARQLRAQRLARAKALAAQTNGYPRILSETRQRGIDSASVIETNVVIEANR